MQRQLLILLTLVTTTIHAQKAPRAIEISPKPGSEVAPGESEILLVFDQDMAPGMSLTLVDRDFPEILGQPGWKDARTFVAKVRLEPGKDYGFSINNRRHTGFRSQDGRIVKPRVVRFSTKGRALGDRERQKRAIARLRRAFDERYSHRELHGVAGAKLKLDEEALSAATSARDFADKLAPMLAHIPDPHLWLRVDGRIVPLHRRRYEANFDVKTVARRLGNWNKITNNLATAKVNDDVRYLLLATLADEKSVAAAITELKREPRPKAWIIDLRPNGGGDERRARRLAGLFVEKPVTYAKHRSVRPGTKEGFGPIEERILEPVRPHLDLPIAVLIGPGCLSSSEALVLMFRQAPRARLFGAPTGGSSGNPRPIDLGNGVELMLPSWQAFDADGKPFEGKGIRPDVEVLAGRRDFAAGRDPVLEAALVDLERRLRR